MIHTLYMDTWYGWDNIEGWKTPAGECLCGDGVREIFDIPEGTKRITVCMSDEPVDDVVKGLISTGPDDIHRIHFFDGAVSQVLNDKFGRWLGRAPFWLWIEY